ncbi:hypothetical protein SAMN05660776_0638 [Salegentibacter holothuriorum]|uniref:Lipoprotein n=1 Tax=Salegentibacter holothuriorum TaxID=241145 RepID=A0A1T5AJR7_9FLAO|nr:hypothetical protein [Salegentibacter holothuriorum]SKB35196.1 hypothetical protein SAMN05660776_0638 [Salegentibacter holothuriorum]
MYKYRFLLLIGLIVSCSSNQTEFGNSELLQKHNPITISELKENPTDFDNDTVRLVGELHLDLENKGISFDSHKIWIDSFKPASDLDTIWEYMNGKEIEIIGLYQSGHSGHLGIYDGQLKEVYYIKTK